MRLFLGPAGSPSLVVWPPFPDSHSPVLQTPRPSPGLWALSQRPPHSQQVLQGRGGAQFQGLIRANEGSALQMPARDTGEHQTACSPPMRPGALDSLLPLSRRGTKGHTLRQGKGDLEESSQVQRMSRCHQETGTWGARTRRQHQAGFSLGCLRLHVHRSIPKQASKQKTAETDSPPSSFHGIPAGQRKGPRALHHPPTATGPPELPPRLAFLLPLPPTFPFPLPSASVALSLSCSRPQHPHQANGEAGAEGWPLRALQLKF